MAQAAVPAVAATEIPLKAEAADPDVDPATTPAKIRAGGRISTCPECSEESTVKYLGLANGDGKQAAVTVLAFESSTDREKYSSFYRNNAGYHKGKSCQLGSHLSTDPGVRFRTVTQSSATNHKGRM
jgi:hypothetical protein